MHFVTSSQGKSHVKSHEQRKYNAGLVGPGAYVMDVGDQLAATMVDANTMRIGSGSMVANGAHLDFDGTDEVKIENGSPGMSRIDLVCARVQVSPVEKAELVVITGKSSASDPAAPECAGGNLFEDAVAEFPLYSIAINDVSVGNPTPLFDKIAPYKEAWDSISQVLLYDNDGGAKGNISLTRSAAEFEEIEIFFFTYESSNSKATKSYGSVKVCQPNGKTISMTNVRVASDSDRAFLLSTRSVKISGATVSTQSKSTFNAAVMYNQLPWVDNNNDVYIHRVVGSKAI